MRGSRVDESGTQVTKSLRRLEGCISCGGQGTDQEEVANKIKKWKNLAEDFGFRLPEVAFQFAALPKMVRKLCIGFKNAEEVKASLALCRSRKIPNQLWIEAKKRGLIENHINFEHITKPK